MKRLSLRSILYKRNNWAHGKMGICKSNLSEALAIASLCFVALTTNTEAQSYQSSPIGAETSQSGAVENCKPSPPGASDSAWFACMGRRQREQAAQRQNQYGEIQKRAAYNKNPLVLKLHEEYNPAVKYPDYCFSPGYVGYAAEGLSDDQLHACVDASEDATRRNQLAVQNQNRLDGAAIDARLTKLPGSGEFTVLVPCPPGESCAARDGSGSKDIFFKVWTPWIKASNGYAIKVDMASVLGNNNGWAAVFEGVPHVTAVYAGLRLWAFDCAGHMNDITVGTSPIMDIPPKSLVGEAANIVCTTLHHNK